MRPQVGEAYTVESLVALLPTCQRPFSTDSLDLLETVAETVCLVSVHCPGEDEAVAVADALLLLAHDPGPRWAQRLRDTIFAAYDPAGLETVIAVIDELGHVDRCLDDPTRSCPALGALAVLSWVQVVATVAQLHALSAAEEFAPLHVRPR